MSIEIKITNGQDAFYPGDDIAGIVRWNLSKNPKIITINLTWRTEGKGSQDVEVIDSLDFPVSKLSGEESFSFTLPIAPYSYSGRLISICWALETFVRSSKDEFSYNITMGPNAKEVTV